MKQHVIRMCALAALLVSCKRGEEIAVDRFPDKSGPVYQYVDHEGKIIIIPSPHTDR